jgi:hypothetical protein
LHPLEIEKIYLLNCVFVNDLWEAFHNEVQIHCVRFLVLLHNHELRDKCVKFNGLLSSNRVSFHLFFLFEHILSNLFKVIAIPTEHNLANYIPEFSTYLIFLCLFSLSRFFDKLAKINILHTVNNCVCSQKSLWISKIVVVGACSHCVRASSILGLQICRNVLLCLPMSLDKWILC